MGLASKTWKPASKFDFLASKLEKVASNSDFRQVNGGKWQVNIYLPVKTRVVRPAFVLFKLC